MMATYFHGGSEIQATAAADNLQTLYLMNPNYISSYSSESPHNHHSQTSPNMFLFNHPSAGPNALAQGSITQAPQQQQQLIGIPLPSDNNPGRQDPTQHNHQIPPTLHGLAASRVHYNLWSPTVDPNPTHTQTVTVAGQADVDGFRRPTGAAGPQGLSLSLSPHHQQQNSGQVIAGADDGRMSVTVVGGGGSSSVSNGVQGVILGSKYLKAAQELLDQVVNVGNYKDLNGNNNKSSGGHKQKAKAAASTAAEGSSPGGGEGGSGDIKRPAEQLTAAQRQELQMKKAKLLNMLDEVEQRYRQYHTQMQVVVSSFEQASGIGSAKSYTSLALKTISRQFRCLKDAITSQIKATNKSLGEEDSNTGPGGKLEGGAGSRLRFVDHQLRQQRALQQLGMMQNNAWRPQRGLPELAVSVLRAWLFEHFLHPYPKDSDKHMLAKQTGLTRSQVSNWFINARVRLWKPMVEEMYAEEMKAQEQQNGGTSEDNTTTIANNSTHPSNEHEKDPSISKTTITTTATTSIVAQQHERHATAILHHHQQHPGDHHTTNDMISNMSTTSSQGFTLIGSSSDMESLMAQRSPKKQRSGSDIQNSPSSILAMDMEMKPPENHHGIGSTTAGFNTYIVHDIGRFNPDQLAGHPYHGNNGVSLTLGLPHCENLSLSGNHHHQQQQQQQNFIPSQGMQLGRRLEIGAHGAESADFCGISVGQPSHHANGYESIDLQSRKRFAAHLLHDFVA